MQPTLYVGKHRYTVNQDYFKLDGSQTEPDLVARARRAFAESRAYQRLTDSFRRGSPPVVPPQSRAGVTEVHVAPLAGEGQSGPRIVDVVPSTTPPAGSWLLGLGREALGAVLHPIDTARRVLDAGRHRVRGLLDRLTPQHS